MDSLLPPVLQLDAHFEREEHISRKEHERDKPKAHCFELFIVYHLLYTP